MKNFTTTEMAKIARYLKVINMTLEEIDATDFEIEITPSGISLVKKDIEPEITLGSVFENLIFESDPISEIFNPTEVDVTEEDHSYDEMQECFDGYDAFQNTPKSILEVIVEVLNNPIDYNDAYIGACVRTRAAIKAVTSSKDFWEETEATLVYARELQELKKFW